MKQHFKAPWGTGLKCLSFFSTLFLGPMCLATLPIACVNASSWLALLICLVPWLIVVPAACYAVRGYTLDANILRIHRLFWDTVIPINGLKYALTMPEAMSGSIRIYGNGGLYSITGHYWNRRLGHYRAYVNDWKRPVVLIFHERNTIVLSPDDPEDFVEAVKAAVTPP